MSDTPNTDAALHFAQNYPMYKCTCGELGVKLWVHSTLEVNTLLCCECLEEQTGGYYTGNPFVGGCFPAITDARGRWMAWSDVSTEHKIQWYRLPTWHNPHRETASLRSQVVYLAQRADDQTAWAKELDEALTTAHKKLDTLKGSASAMRKSDLKASNQAIEARVTLKDTWRVTPDTTLYMVHRHRTRGGQHDLSVFLVNPVNDPAAPSLWDIAPLVARVLGWRYNPDSRGVRVPGGGMSPAAALASDLYYALFGNGQNRHAGGTTFHYLEV